MDAIKFYDMLDTGYTLHNSKDNMVVLSFGSFMPNYAIGYWDAGMGLFKGWCNPYKGYSEEFPDRYSKSITLSSANSWFPLSSILDACNFTDFKGIINSGFGCGDICLIKYKDGNIYPSMVGHFKGIGRAFIECKEVFINGGKYCMHQPVKGSDIQSYFYLSDIGGVVQ